MTDLIIPGHVVEKTRMNHAEFLLELAVFLYDKGRLPRKDARELAGLDPAAFQQELVKRKVYPDYDYEDCWEDVHCL